VLNQRTGGINGEIDFLKVFVTECYEEQTAMNALKGDTDATHPSLKEERITWSNIRIYERIKHEERGRIVHWTIIFTRTHSIQMFPTIIGQFIY